jgi:hypothetical protein
MSETVTITVREYERLKERDEVLSALEAGGVDNWEGFTPSLEAYWGD